jgi:hypothetical protein
MRIMCDCARTMNPYNPSGIVQKTKRDAFQGITTLLPHCSEYIRKSKFSYSNAQEQLYEVTHEEQLLFHKIARTKIIYLKIYTTPWLRAKTFCFFFSFSKNTIDLKDI